MALANTNAHSNGTRVYYDAAGGVSYTEFPVPCVSIELDPGQTTEVGRGHLNATNNLHATSPGARQPGQITFNFECATRTDANWDAWQLVYGWWTAQTEGITFKIENPKNSGDTTAPLAVCHGYVNREPVLSYPEDGRMMLTLSVRRTDDFTLTDGA